VAKWASFAQGAIAGSLETGTWEYGSYTPLETSRAHCCACQ
jgi:hypothetical protein